MRGRPAFSRRLGPRSVPILLLAAALASAVPAAQAPRREVTVAATDTPAVAAWAARVERLLQRGDLALEGLQPDTMIGGRVHERLAQRHQGLPVFGAGLTRQMDGPLARTVFGRLYAAIDVDPAARVAPADALGMAAAAHGPDAVTDGSPVLGILPLRGGGYALAWRVRVRTPRDIRAVFVDAHHGGIALDRSRLRSQLPGIGAGTGVGGDRKKLAARRRTQRFEAVDETRPARLETYTFAGLRGRLDEYLLTGLLFDADLAADDDNVWSDGAVVDGHVQQGLTYDYYYKRFARRGMDDRDGAIATIVHPLDAGEDDPDGLYVNNALYLGDRTMLYGDGDGRSFAPLAGALDIVAHEWTHGVLEFSSGLQYFDEPGALAESFADIMGTAAEFFFQPPGNQPRHADWLIGEDVTRAPPGFIRSLRDPAAAGHPDHVSLMRLLGTDIDNGGVHVNNGVPNHAFYLAVAGGTHRVSGIAVQGIGPENIERMERIFYRAFVFFLGPTASFRDARAATLQAASELYGGGSVEREQLERAWRAVGVD